MFRFAGFASISIAISYSSFVALFGELSFEAETVDAFSKTPNCQYARSSEPGTQRLTASAPSRQMRHRNIAWE
jgi:hypothetical protein